MGRFKAEILSVACLALLGLTLPLMAQESAQQEKQEKNPASPTTKATHGSWKQVAEGVWKAHISRFPDDKEGKEKPEFAILRLSADRYTEFQKDRKKFLNDNKIFAHPVKKTEECAAAKPQSEQPAEAYWYAILAHWPGSTALCQAYPGWSE